MIKHLAHLFEGPIKYIYLARRLACCPSTTRPCTTAQLRLIISPSSFIETL